MKELNENLVGIVKCLSDGEFHDGTAIGEKFQITRAAVWKLIKKLEAYEIPMESVKGKGYALRDDLILLDAKKIKKQLRNKKIPIDVFEEIDSTNDYLKPFISENKTRVCISESQTSGRGRFNRQWHSPFGQNIYLSLLYPFKKDLSELRGLSIAISIAIVEAIEQSFHIPEMLLLKWPNDIFCNNRKLGGSLIEIQGETNGYSTMVLGVGINVNMLSDPKRKITESWTSIRKANDLYNDRNLLCANLISHLLETLDNFGIQSLPRFQKRWQQRDFLFNKVIDVKSHSTITKGKMLGLDDFGNLQLKLKNGKVQVFSSGDTSLKASG